MRDIRRIYAEKRQGFDIEARRKTDELKNEFLISGLDSLRIINRYDIKGISPEEYRRASKTVFSEPNADILHDESIQFEPADIVFATEYLPGQFDQRADSAVQCLQLMTGRKDILVRYARVIAVSGDLKDTDILRIKDYFINPVESREASLGKPESLDDEGIGHEEMKILRGFISAGRKELKKLAEDLRLAMSMEDIIFCQRYFRDEERRDPTYTEIRVIDTYWSDHCRHTTFLAKIRGVKFGHAGISRIVRKTYKRYLDSREFVYGGRPDRPVCLMDIATIAAKHLKKEGYLGNVEETDEINACSIKIDVITDTGTQKWVLMFKNETHNHPTEIEPFGGAATCLGGAIRDPLSGRVYVYQAMRVTGSGDPNTPVKDTIPGKLPQRTITKGAADGYSSYGNQIGIATGQVCEIYDNGYIAKRMEVGTVIGAAPAENIRREKPVTGDVVILLGGRTGRDGCGGATGSSKEHNEDSLKLCGAEVQKGNPPVERKIQRLFRDPAVTGMIRRCNDFGAGGVSVAIGELAEGVEIWLDRVPKKYEGLTPVEIAISESQERMAVVVSEKDADSFIDNASAENLEATAVARVTDDGKMRMTYLGETVLDIKRSFLNTSGAAQYAEIMVKDTGIMKKPCRSDEPVSESMLLDFVSGLNICSQRGLAEKFDSTIGSGTILMPYGGRYQLTPEQGMAALIPVIDGQVYTASLAAFGYDSRVSSESPFIGGQCAVVESISKIVAMGADYRDARLTFQEYFEKPGDNPLRWSKPFCSLLGAFDASMELKVAAIGGKDSMSGTFRDMDVPPTLISFAVAATDASSVISSEFKAAGSVIYLLETDRDNDHMIDFEQLKRNFFLVKEMISRKKVRSVRALASGGILEAVLKMAFGNKMGMVLEGKVTAAHTRDRYGSFVLEADEMLLSEYPVLKRIGCTADTGIFKYNGIDTKIDDVISSWSGTLEDIFPVKAIIENNNVTTITHDNKKIFVSKNRYARPNVFIPVFPGTNCEYDSMKRFKRAGGEVFTEIFRNLEPEMINDSVDAFVKAVDRAQIIMLPGGFSAGDEPEGSGKFIATVFRNSYISEAVTKFLEHRDGLILGICNGFQALIKLGLLPYGRISDITERSPTLTFNSIGRHMSRIVRTRIASAASPWLMNTEVGRVYNVPVSHGEGRFFAEEEILRDLTEKGQIATQYVDLEGKASYEIEHNPNGSVCAVEGLLSENGKIFGKMGHIERTGEMLYKNIGGSYDPGIFEAGIDYFK